MFYISENDEEHINALLLMWDTAQSEQEKERVLDRIDVVYGWNMVKRNAILGLVRDNVEIKFVSLTDIC